MSKPEVQEGQAQDNANQEQLDQTKNPNPAGEKTDSGTSEKKKENINKLENPESIPTAGGKKLGEDHMGESKMLKDGQRNEEESGDTDEAQAELEGKKPSGNRVDNSGGGQGEEKKGMMENVKEKLGMGKKE